MSERRSGLVAATLVLLVAVPLLYGSLYPAMYYMAWAVFVPGFALLALAVLGVRLALVGRPDRWAVPSVLLTVVVVTAVALHLPMKLAFAGSQSALDRAVVSAHLRSGAVGFYTFARGPEPDYCGTRGITVFALSNNQGAFVHAPRGIDALCYNEGSAGHISGDWYYKIDD